MWKFWLVLGIFYLAFGFFMVWVATGYLTKKQAQHGSANTKVRRFEVHNGEGKGNGGKKKTHGA